MKNHLKTTRIIVFLFAIVLIFTNCEKYTTPKKLEKKITEGTWRIGKAVVNKVNVTSTYNGYLFKFTSNKNIVVSGTVSTTGSWYSGNDKNPVILFLSLPASYPELYVFSDDWKVNQLSSSQFVMRRNDNSEDELTFRKTGK